MENRIFEFDEGESYACDQCGYLIPNFSEGHWINPIDEETGEDLEDEQEVYCLRCYNSD